MGEADKRAIACFYEYAFVGIMLDWIGGAVGLYRVEDIQKALLPGGVGLFALQRTGGALPYSAGIWYTAKKRSRSIERGTQRRLLCHRPPNGRWRRR